MIYFTTNSVMYDAKTGEFTVPYALYNNIDRWKKFPMLNNSVFYKVELKRGETRIENGIRYPKPNTVIRYVNR